MYIVRHSAGAGAVSVVCPNSAEALQKLRQFQDEERTGIEALTADGEHMTVQDLMRYAESEGSTETVKSGPSAQ